MNSPLYIQKKMPRRGGRSKEQEVKAQMRQVFDQHILVRLILHAIYFIEGKIYTRWIRISPY